MVRFDLLLQKVLLFTGVIAVPFVPAAVHAQALPAPTTGIYFTAALDQPYLFSYERLFYLGAGLRLSSGTDLGVRAGRSRGVPPGNPLPVTYIGQTVVEGQLSHRIKEASGESGVRLLLASQLVVQDRSQAVQQLPEPVTFRGGRRVSEGHGRIEVQRYWQVSESEPAGIHVVLGGFAEFHTTRSSPLFFDGGAVQGEMEGSTRVAPGMLASVPVSWAVSGNQVLVVEPTLRVHPIPSAYGVWMASGITAHLNF
jgi:hypothetical protein